MKKSFPEKTDFCWYFAETGNRPQNYIKDDKISERYKDYPKNQKIIELKT